MRGLDQSVWGTAFNMLVAEKLAHGSGDQSPPRCAHSTAISMLRRKRSDVWFDLSVEED